VAIKAYCELLIWPAALASWLASGRPPSRALYGPEAVERLYGDPDNALLPGFRTNWKAT
jgi:hypothetical protein